MSLSARILRNIFRQPRAIPTGMRDQLEQIYKQQVQKAFRRSDIILCFEGLPWL